MIHVFKNRECKTSNGLVNYNIGLKAMLFDRLLRVRCFKVVGSLLSYQNTGMSENTTRIFIPHERSNFTQDFTQAQQGL